jgi:hypothetical protein
MNLQIARVTIAASALLALPLISSAAGLTPGLYEYTMTSDMPVAPGGDARPQVRRECVTAASLENIGQLGLAPKGGNCQIRDMIESGGQFSYKVICPEPLKAETTVKGSATGIVINTTMSMGMGHTMKTSLTGKRIGDCKQ